MSRPGAILAFATAILLAGCGGKEPAAVSVAVIGEGKARLVDPSAGPLDTPQQVLMLNTAQGLVRFDANGEIQPALAERWNVSDDGLSYIFRLQSAEWPDGRKINARDVARQLKRQLRPASRNPIKDTLGAIEDIVAMTDRVIEIRLTSPRPYLLQLLAQPEMGVLRGDIGAGPFTIDRKPAGDALAMTYHKRVIDGPDEREHVLLSVRDARGAIAAFDQGKAQLVLGGTFDDLPLAQAAKPGSALRFDPVVGLFGLLPKRTKGPFAERDVRSALSAAIDRQALVDALAVPGLVPRDHLIQADQPASQPLEGGTSSPHATAAPAGAAGISRAFGTSERPTAKVFLPKGPGADLVLARLAADWGKLGIKVERAPNRAAADFELVDLVAPTNSAAWFVRRFRCDTAKVCSADADKLMDSARLATVAAQRAAFLGEAARLLEEKIAFISIAAPIRWSLVGPRLPGFAGNSVGRHPLDGLGRRLRREGP